MHIPVLQKEVIEYLNPRANQNFIDATIGEGGHAKNILEKIAPNGKVLGIDFDPDQIKNCEKNIRSNRLVLVNDSYANLEEIVEKNSFGPVNGILLDIGMSSWHIGEANKGFSFLKDQALDMRYNQIGDSKTAEDIVNRSSYEEIEKILEEFGEEKYSRKIAKEIIEERKRKPIKTTFQLVGIIEKAAPARYFREKIHFATRTFQALRIAVNDELDSLKIVLPQAVKALKPGGRLAVITFHSLEDRIVKNFFRDTAQKKSGWVSESNIKILTKKPVKATSEELKKNYRARSAKLRVAEKMYDN